MRVYYDRDADINLIKGKKVAVIGYGSQGHAHALNLRDSGVKNVAIALRKTSAGVKKAEAEKLKVMEVAEAAKWADVMMMLTPDELQADIYRDHLRDNMKDGAALDVRAWAQCAFQLDRAPRRSRCRHDRAEGAGPYGALGIPSAAPECHACWRSTRTRAAMRMTYFSPTVRRSAADVPASSRRASRRNARPTCSASRRCSVAVWWS